MNTPDGGYRIFLDGNMWCAVRWDFINLQESPAGFGTEPGRALEELHRDERRVTNSSPGRFEIVTKWVPTTNLMMLRRMGKLSEELNELGTVTARCIIQGIDQVDPSSGKTNRLRLEQEIADVYAQCDETIERLSLRTSFIEERRWGKRDAMRRWEAMFEEGK